MKIFRTTNGFKGLKWLFLIGTFLIVLGVISYVVIALRMDLWQFNPNNIPRVERRERCTKQVENLLERRNSIEKQLQISEQRLVALEKALTDSQNFSFVNARASIEKEENIKRTLKNKLKALSVEQLSEVLPLYLGVLALVIVFSLITGGFAAAHGSSAIKPWKSTANYESWLITYCILVFFYFSINTAREIYTSILTMEKSGFGFNSFCISSIAWGVNLVISLGITMVISYPSTILWQYSSSCNRPADLNMKHHDGQWGVGKYILFLQTWSISTLVFLILPSAIILYFFSDKSSLSLAYLVPSFILIAFAIVLSGRFIGNAVAIRRNYRIELEKLGKSWQDIQKMNPPPDPTINFIGAHWWKMPAVIFSILAALWMIIKIIGVPEIIGKIVSGN